MIDIHTHILPGVDDGSDSMGSSLEMLELAADSGVDVVVATPHCNIPGEYENYASDELRERFQRLKEQAEKAGISVKLLRGMEVYATTDVPRLLRERKIWTLNGSHYMLMEFAFNEDPDFCRSILDRLLSMGVKPVIAHPERYFFVQDDPQTAFEWCISGCTLQVNKGSLLGSFGSGPERTARLLLGHGLAACVASDAHSPYQRTTHMGDVDRLLRMDYGDEYRDLMLRVNPARILRDRSLLGYEPQPF